MYTARKINKFKTALKLNYIQYELGTFDKQIQIIGVGSVVGVIRC